MSKISLKATRFSTVPCLQLICVAAVHIPDYLNTSTAAGVAHVSSVFLHALINTIYLMKFIWVPSTILIISSNMNRNYNTNNRTYCTTA